MTGVTVGIAITILSWHFEDDERTREWEIDWRLIDKETFKTMNEPLYTLND